MKLYPAESKLGFVKNCLVINVFDEIMVFDSRGESPIRQQFWYCVNIVLFSNKGSFIFKHLCKYCIVLDTHKDVMTSNDVKEECLECHMTSNNVKGECQITMVTGRCVNKPDQTEPVGCYKNLVI